MPGEGDMDMILCPENALPINVLTQIHKKEFELESLYSSNYMEVCFVYRITALDGDTATWLRGENLYTRFMWMKVYSSIMVGKMTSRAGISLS